MNLKFRWLLIILVVVVSIVAIYPISSKIKLGLDLQGGMHVVLGVDTEKALEARVDLITRQLRSEFKDEAIAFTYVQKSGEDAIAVSLDNGADRDKTEKFMDLNYPIFTDVSFNQTGNVLTFKMSSEEINQIKLLAVDQSIEVVRNRIDQFGVSEPLIQRQGDNNILVQLPGITDAERAINLIGQTAQLRFHLVNDQIDPTNVEVSDLGFDDVIMYSKNLEKGTGKVLSTEPYVIKSDAVLTGDYLIDAEVRISPQFNTPYVWIKFNPSGSKLFEEITGSNVGKRLAIVLDDNVYSAPNLKEKIAGGEASIDGYFTLETARDLAIVLRAGSLPAPVTILENRTVGPSLGADSIEAGLRACLIGLIAVMLFVGIYYRWSGVVANTALLLNLLILLGVLALFKATLTLPGIAGILLTLGLAVDANVLIFERIREEMRQGRTALNALEIGYEKAFWTIVDANVTSLIAAIVLFQFGTGPVKGFAITLTVGLLASMFTAIFVTRTILTEFVIKRKVKTLSI